MKELLDPVLEIKRYRSSSSQLASQDELVLYWVISLISNPELLRVVLD
jgi:hypothetical protein